ncbi:MAG: WXG100 family type VII secretion target [Atopobiaceae bacterium]|nr:WXG100 family type VII secretion target [Atopobiaceae bacterium]
MAGQIRITPDQMRTRAVEYDNEANKVGEVIGKMDQLLGLLQEEWEGEASRAYADRFMQLRPSFTNAQQLINEIATALRNTATTLEQTDVQVAAGLRG